MSNIIFLNIYYYLLKLLFDTWDEDGSGTLDIGEMVQAVRSFG